MMHYARCDTHFLLYIWDRIRNQLSVEAEKNNLEINQVMKDVFVSSHEVSLKEVEMFNYEKMDVYQNYKYQLKTKDFVIMDKIFRHISDLAKKNDESF